MTISLEIERRLQELAPEKFELIDDSALHEGHAGNNGGGHFKLKIISSHFYQKSPIIRHRMIYALLSDLIPHSIHALSIEAISPEEFNS